MPAFWDTSHCPMITHTIDSHQIPSPNKTKSKLQILKKCQKIKIKHFARSYTFDTPSEVAKLDVQISNGSKQNCWCYRVNTKCGTDGRTDGRTDWRSETNIPPKSFFVQGYNKILHEQGYSTRNTYWKKTHCFKIPLLREGTYNFINFVSRGLC